MHQIKPADCVEKGPAHAEQARLGQDSAVSALEAMPATWAPTQAEFDEQSNVAKLAQLAFDTWGPMLDQENAWPLQWSPRRAGAPPPLCSCSCAAQSHTIC